MKLQIKRAFLLLSILMAIAFISYFILDRRLYYFGKSHFDYYEKLPLNIKPQYWNYDKGNLGFALVDEDELILVSRGNFQYVGSNTKLSIKEVIKYGYVNEKLIVEIKDVRDKKHLILFTRSNDSKRDIAITIIDNTTDVYNESYKWVEIKTECYRTTQLFRNYILFTIIIFLTGMIYLGVNLKKD